MAAPWTHIVRKIDDYRWEIPRSYKPEMRVPGLVFASEEMLRQIAQEQALEQVAQCCDTTRHRRAGTRDARCALGVWISGGRSRSI